MIAYYSLAETSHRQVIGKQNKYFTSDMVRLEHPNMGLSFDTLHIWQKHFLTFTKHIHSTAKGL
jgi:hypothetical protein